MSYLGPYGSERDTWSSPLLQEVHGMTPGRGVYAATNRTALLAAVRGAGVRVGDFDLRIVDWLSGWEPSTVQVVIGLIGRAYTAGADNAEPALARVRQLTGTSGRLYERDGRDLVSVEEIRAALNGESK